MKEKESKGQFWGGKQKTKYKYKVIMKILEALYIKLVGKTFLVFTKHPFLGDFLALVILVLLSTCCYLTYLYINHKVEKISIIKNLAHPASFLIALLACCFDQLTLAETPEPGKNKQIDLNQEYQPSSSSSSHGSEGRVQDEGASASSSAPVVKGIPAVVKGFPINPTTGELLYPSPSVTDFINAMYVAWQRESITEKKRLLGYHIDPNTPMTSEEKRVLVKNMIQRYTCFLLNRHSSIDPLLAEVRRDVSYSGVYQDFRRSIDKP